jgi:hypothetical protein
MRSKRLPLFSSWRQSVPRRIEGLATGVIGQAHLTIAKIERCGDAEGQGTIPINPGAAIKY